jgi:hypothetical protein
MTRVAVPRTPLERFADRIIRCHVIVGLERRHDCIGRRYSVDLDISTSLGSIAVTREPGAAPRGLAEIIREAFDAATRELQADVGTPVATAGHGTPDHCLS